MARERMNQAERGPRGLHPAMILLGATLAGLFLALLGPFGSYLNGGFATRALYWIAASWLGLALYGRRYACDHQIFTARLLPELPGHRIARRATRGKSAGHYADG